MTLRLIIGVTRARERLKREKVQKGSQNERYQEDLRATQAALEAHPDWLRLLEDDREEIASRLKPSPVEVDSGNPVRSLRTLLVRRSTIAGLLQELRTEVERRGPAESPPGQEEAEEVEVRCASCWTTSPPERPAEPTSAAALRQAEAEARAAGLLPDEVDEARAAETTILGAG